MTSKWCEEHPKKFEALLKARAEYWKLLNELKILLKALGIENNVESYIEHWTEQWKERLFQ